MPAVLKNSRREFQRVFVIRGARLFVRGQQQEKFRVKVFAVLVRQANLVRERNGSVLGENRLRRGRVDRGVRGVARARTAVDLHAAGFEETREQTGRVLGGFFDGNREPARRRVERHRAAHANQARTGIARHGQFFLAAARAGTTEFSTV